MIDNETSVIIKEEPMYQPIEYSCLRCNLDFCDVQEVKRHVHQEGCRYNCSFCCQIFDTKVAVISHGKEHHNYNGYTFEDTCDFDELKSHHKTFVNHQFTVNLSKSVKQLINSEKFCEVGSFTDSNEQNDAKTQKAAAHQMHLETLSFGDTKNGRNFCHVADHDGKKTHQCMECGKCFAKPKYLNAHLRIHTANKVYKCTECGLSFSNQNARDNHSKVHSAVKSYKCDECGKSFAQYGILLRHSRNHINEKLHKCKHCDMSFLDSSNLEYHLRAHTHQKPYQCEECGQRFSIKSDLDSHSQLHTSEKSYECNDCGRHFALKRHIVSHIKCHIKEKIMSVIF